MIYNRAICDVQVADIFIYSILAWYFAQVWPSKVGVPKPFYFFLESSYWCNSRFSTRDRMCAMANDAKIASEEEALTIEGALYQPGGPRELVNKDLVGQATVRVHKLRKTYGESRAVNDLSFEMYENQIYALLGHNGAGKVY